ncbi:glycosyltransferase family 2 protein [Robertkochia flava]|uniref:glycosyltransferase family 2 protein n=1 Tax=Robertkochia flava TaxID=3447986 RepID=UPI001CCF0084|nr:glycosyltransferase family 2 protein [Robertkochia marina]
MSRIKQAKQPTRKERNILRIIIVLGVISLLNFFYWFFSPEYIGNPFLYGLLTISVGYISLRLIYEWYHYWNITVPANKESERLYTVDFLTTYFPGEPYDMIENTLLAIKNVDYPHTTILCDEANDPHLIAFCKKHGIKHISRDNRKDAKAGNINNALRNIATGEICVILDPDHVPEPEFLDAIIPYFEDEEIGYVQIVQAYKNFDESYVAKGAAQQTFQFYGPMMMCMNSYGTVNAIGANCTFRRAALDSIGGHAPGLAEDMHTAMLLHAKGWKSIYVPKVLARGLVPSSMTAYYKQQLKWARGTLELLVAVYPKIFRTLSWRQRIHYATIPLHYLIGFIFLINFLIPIISLVTASNPWGGNILFFGLITIPLIASILVIRSFVQRWVMEESERGFHMVGGLLLISTWWIFCLGAVYTLIRKKVPYLPTPKTGEDKTSWKLMAPNIVIALASLAAIVYGLNRNFTPFSIFMSGFALLNFIFMLFSLYLARHKYVNIEGISNKSTRAYYSAKLWLKQRLWNFRHNLYRGIRQVALPLVVFSFVASSALVTIDRYKKWEGVKSFPELPVLPNKLLGVYAPGNINGVSNYKKAHETELALSTKFDLISHYIPWGNQGQQNAFDAAFQQAKAQHHTPFITWEPWASTFDVSGKVPELKEEKKVFKFILEGTFDNYLRDIAYTVKEYNNTVYIRFAHEFDNPQYPWSSIGDNTAEEFKGAWKYVVQFFRDQNVKNVKWVWNPWKADQLASYYPGDPYVDFIGVTALNYEKLSSSGRSYSFDDLYTPIKDALRAAGIDKPVILSEFGSLNFEDAQEAWILDALDSIYLNYPEITGVLFFNSSIDENIPVKTREVTQLDWSLNETRTLKDKLWELELENPPDSLQYLGNLEFPNQIDNTKRLKLPDQIQGISYKKGQNWFKNYQVMDINTVEHDFALIKQLGMNTVKYYGSRVYNPNMLKAAKKEQLNIVYGLWMPESLGHSREDAMEVEEKILNTVEHLKGEEEIIAWNLGNDIITRINQYNKEANARQKIFEHVAWLKDLLQKIKSIDPDRPVILDLDLNRYSSKNAILLLTEIPDLDALSVKVGNYPYNHDFFQFSELANLPVIIGDITTENLVAESNIPNHYFLRNWQDQHESNLVSFDGLLDHQGRKKQNYAAYLSFTQKKPHIDLDAKVNILRPSTPLKENRKYDYYALIKPDKNTDWRYATNRETEDLEWTLVKCDPFGTPLAFKNLGKGLMKTVEIPEQYENYFLVLKYIPEDIVYSTKMSLNLPNQDTPPLLFAQFGL